MNFLAVSPQTGANIGRISGPGNLSIAMVANNPTGPIAEIGVRPEGLRLVAENEGRITCTLERVEDLGHEHFAYCRITDDTVWVIRLASAPSIRQDWKIRRAGLRGRCDLRLCSRWQTRAAQGIV
jgi:multiple sugar transport system ATP-binding protein